VGKEAEKKLQAELKRQIDEERMKLKDMRTQQQQV
jgi:hypothetical protein